MTSIIGPCIGRSKIVSSPRTVSSRWRWPASTIHARSSSSPAAASPSALPIVRIGEQVAVQQPDRHVGGSSASPRPRKAGPRCGREHQLKRRGSRSRWPTAPTASTRHVCGGRGSARRRAERLRARIFTFREPSVDRAARYRPPDARPDPHPRARARPPHPAPRGRRRAARRGRRPRRRPRVRRRRRGRHRPRRRRDHGSRSGSPGSCTTVRVVWSSGARILDTAGSVGMVAILAVVVTALLWWRRVPLAAALTPAVAVLGAGAIAAAAQAASSTGPARRRRTGCSRRPTPRSRRATRPARWRSG